MPVALTLVGILLAVAFFIGAGVANRHDRTVFMVICVIMMIGSVAMAIYGFWSIKFM